MGATAAVPKAAWSGRPFDRGPTLGMAVGGSDWTPDDPRREPFFASLRPLDHGAAAAARGATHGTAQTDTLAGTDADELLNGDVGNDSLRASVGSDSYVFGRDGNQDLVDNRDLAGNGVVGFGTGISQIQLWWQHVGNDLTVSIVGIDDRLTIQGWYVSEQNIVDAFTFADGITLYDSQVNQLVSAMAAFILPAVGQTILPTDQQAALDPSLSISWQNVNSGRSDE